MLARLRNGAPLIVEQRFGQGHVVAVLTSAAPTWNNWSQKREASWPRCSTCRLIWPGVPRVTGRTRWARRCCWSSIRASTARRSASCRRIVRRRPWREAAAAEPGLAFTADATPTRTGMLAVTVADVKQRLL